MNARFVPALFGGLFSLFIFLAFIGIYIYMFVLFVKLAHRGIKALDIYISKNSNTYYPGPQTPQGQNYAIRQSESDFNSNDNRNEG